MTDDRPRRFQALDGWRGICALLIALHHFPARGLIYHLPLVRNSWMLVDFFFVLSGFVIAHVYREALSTRKAAADFVVRRFFRLWPLHVAVLAAFIVLEAYRYVATGSGFTGERSAFAIFTNLALIQSLGFHDGLTWNTPAWAVSTEFWTYVIFAIAALLAIRLRFVLSVVIVGLSVSMLLFHSRYGMRETFDWGIARCCYGFFLGALVYEARLRRWRARFCGSMWEVAAFLLAFLFLVFIPGNRPLEYLAPLVFAFFIVVFAEDCGVLSRAMAHPLLARLGAWSYAIYLVQMLVIAVMISAVVAFAPSSAMIDPNGTTYIQSPMPHANDVITLAYLAIVVALAALVWRWVELPGQRLSRLFKPQASGNVVSEAGAE